MVALRTDVFFTVDVQDVIATIYFAQDRYYFLGVASFLLHMTFTVLIYGKNLTGNGPILGSHVN